MSKEYRVRRMISHALMILSQHLTIRQTAKQSGFSRQTVYLDVTERLNKQFPNSNLARDVRQVLDYHKSVRHLRGGEATKRRYQKNED